MNLYQYAFRQCDSLDDVALTYIGQNITYGSLKSTISSAAMCFHALGVRRGSVVTMATASTPESIASFYALNKMGAIPAMVDVRFRAEKIADLMDNLDSYILLIMGFMLRDVANSQRLLKRCQHIIVFSGAESFPKYITVLFKFADYFNGRWIKIRKNQNIIRFEDFLNIKKHGDVNIDNQDEYNSPVIFHTSGTTGEPKGVELSSETLNDTTSISANILGEIGKTDSLLSVLPIFTLYGFITQIHLPLSKRCKFYCVPYLKNSETFLKILEKFKPNHVIGVHTHWSKFTNKRHDTLDLSFLKTVIFAGDRLRLSFLNSLQNWIRDKGGHAAIINIYGMTETGGAISMASTRRRSEHSTEDGFAGWPVKNVNLKVIDGEICVNTPRALKQYVNNVEATKELMQTDEHGQILIHTGDAGIINDDGSITVTGRIKRMITYHDGSKIFPIEIEDAIMRIPNIKDCAVIPIRDKEYPLCSVPCAVVVLGEGTSHSVTDIRRHLNRTLPIHYVPNLIITTQEIPHTSTGKVDYAALIAMLPLK